MLHLREANKLDKAKEYPMKLPKKVTRPGCESIKIKRLVKNKKIRDYDRN